MFYLQKVFSIRERKEKVSLTIALILLQLLIAAQSFAQEIYGDQNNIVNKTEAKKIALIYASGETNYAKILYAETVFEYEANSAYAYIVVLATSREFAQCSKSDIKKLYNKSLSDSVLSEKLLKGLMTVYVSATKDRPPVPLSNEGVPFSVTRQKDAIKKVAEYLSLPEEILTVGKLIQIYRQGTFVEVKEIDNATVALVRLMDLQIMRDDAMPEVQARTENYDERIQYFQDKWEFYEQKISESISYLNEDYFESGKISSVIIGDTTYINGYGHASLKWTQNQITPNLPCMNDKGCCFVSATTALLAFWDDHKYLKKGPFEDIIDGEGTNQAVVSNFATEVYSDFANGKCEITNCVNKISNTIANVTRYRGYSFKISVGDLLLTENDVKTEVDNNRPFIWLLWDYWTASGEINHIVVGVGYNYDVSNAFRIRAYKNTTSSSALYNFYFDNPWDIDLHQMVKIIPNYRNLTINGTTLNGNISQAGEADLYSFVVKTAGTYTIETWAVTLTDNYMYLYGPNNQTTIIEEDDDDGVGTAAKITRYLAPGTYYVKIRAYSSSGTGTYTISLKKMLLNDGLVAYYPFNGNTNDESGNGNNGNIYGATLTSDRLGHSNSAYSFDGIDDYIQVPYSSINHPTAAITVTCWFKIDSYTLYDMISTQQAGGYGLEFYPDGLSWALAVNSYYSSYYLVTVPYPEISYGLWHFFAGTFDGNVMRIYLDGILKDEMSITGSIYYAYMNSIIIGADAYTGTTPDPSYGYFKGSIDEVRIYNRALSEAEIQRLY